MLLSIFIMFLLAGITIAQTQDTPIITNEPAGASYLANMQSTKSPKGSITGVSNETGTGVFFNVNLFDFPGDQGPFLYHIHEFPVPSSGNCTGTGPHFDPYNRTETPPCDPAAEQTCQLGDLSGKHGSIPANITGGSYQVLVNDLYLSTKPGNEAFFGNRSIVIHNKDGVRIQCANFTSQEKSARTTTSSAATTSSTAISASAAASSESSSVSSASVAASRASGSASSASASAIATGNSAALAKTNGGAIFGVAAMAWAFV